MVEMLMLQGMLNNKEMVEMMMLRGMLKIKKMVENHIKGKTGEIDPKRFVKKQEES